MTLRMAELIWNTLGNFILYNVLDGDQNEM